MESGEEMNLEGYEWAENLYGIISIEIALLVFLTIYFIAPLIFGTGLK
jgi:hypothetical protein